MSFQTFRSKLVYRWIFWEKDRWATQTNKCKPAQPRTLFLFLFGFQRQPNTIASTKGASSADAWVEGWTVHKKGPLIHYIFNYVYRLDVLILNMVAKITQNFFCRFKNFGLKFWMGCTNLEMTYVSGFVVQNLVILDYFLNFVWDKFQSKNTISAKKNWKYLKSKN